LVVVVYVCKNLIAIIMALDLETPASKTDIQRLEKKLDVLLDLTVKIQAHVDTLLNAQAMTFAQIDSEKEPYQDIIRKALQAVRNEEDQLRSNLGLPLR
jgi:Arc/MetJ family transcription regulator